MRLIKQLLFLLSSFSILVLYQNCTGIQQPKASNESSVVHFSHAVLTSKDSCTTCHEKDRKSANHYPGKDCKECHDTTAWTSTVNAGHSQDQKECASCHGDGKMHDSINLQGVDHLIVGNLDCLECHAASKTNSFANWTGAKMLHKLTMNTCAECHGTGKFQDTMEITGYSHFDFGNTDCLACHEASKTANFLNWKNGSMLHKASMTTCNECHTTGSFHDSIALQNYDHLNYGSSDCLECHEASKTNNYVDWKGGVMKHKMTMTTCSECHGSGQRQDSIALQNYNHINYDNADCLYCHEASKTNNFVDWKGGKMQHKATMTSCKECHGAGKQRDSIVVYNVADHPMIGSSDCIDCHRKTIENNFVDWKGATAKSHPDMGSTAGSTLDCASCHGMAGTAVNKLKTVVAEHFYQASSCIGCHSDYTSFKGNHLKYNHATPVASGNCFECHNFDSGSYTSYTKIANFNVGSNFTLNSTTVVRGSTESDFPPDKSFSSTHADVKLKSCRDCHIYTAPTTASTNVWRFQHRPTNYGVRYSRAQAANIQGCTSCHEHQ